jgi:20S proteasome alpha/beta subunit
MTVCIAATPTLSPATKLILCADGKYGGALGSKDFKLKILPISDTFNCLTSGADSEIIAVVRLFKDCFLRAQTIDETNIVPLVQNALNARKYQKIEELVRGKFAISYKKFLEIGKQSFPDHSFRSTMTEIDLMRIDADFIIAGFDSNKVIHMVQTDGKGRVALKEDFAAIGEGAFLAQASLLNRKIAIHESFENMLYCVYEAKRFSESVGSVGPTTNIFVADPDGQVVMMSEQGMQILKAAHQASERQKIAAFDLRKIPFISARPLNPGPAANAAAGAE